MSSTTFEPALLPDVIKEQTCRELLAEFGVDRISHNPGKGELTCRCPLPWHEDRHPSASLNYKKMVFSCFSCGSSGGLIWFISSCRRTTGKQARDWLENRSGTGSDSQIGQFLELLDAIYAEKGSDRTPIPVFSPEVLKPWRYVHRYMTDFRHVPRQNVIDLQIGWDPDTDRIVFPHFWRGKLVGWQSRRIHKDGSPKYLSTGDFPKKETIYNHQPGRELCVVVESPASVARHTHHLPIEGTFGAEVTDRQVKLLARHKKIVLFMDNDKAGWNAVEGTFEDPIGKRPPEKKAAGMGERLERYTDVWVVENPWKADAGDMDDETVEALVDLAVPYALWRRPDPSTLLRWG
jgi:hypothetical protein